tara:strand:- start:2918 stop:3961 length:1044 start_codon:yes stop_codon:yes gene_type:complete
VKTAIILFNLGGPDRLDAVRPFLRNLFRDPAILRVPGLLRWLLSWLIARRRATDAKRIYAKIGGRSPLLTETEKQAAALRNELSHAEGQEYRVFIAMRYWHPFVSDVVGKVASFAPDRTVLLPLYPQFSTTTTASSFREWHRQASARNLAAQTVAICCYPAQANWVTCQADLLSTTISQSNDEPAAMRILFSAHGLPKRIVASGDPYPDQVNQTAQAIIGAISNRYVSLDWVVCYQSRVGPLEWIGPSTESEIKRAGRDGKALVVVPISFVSEHSETMVELDMDYRELAERCGVVRYHRVPAAGIHPQFIKGLAVMIESVLRETAQVTSMPPGRTCDKEVEACPCKL